MPEVSLQGIDKEGTIGGGNIPTGLNFSVYFPDKNTEEAYWFSKVPNRSQWVLEQIRKAMMVDEKKLLREKEELLAKVADIDEMIQLNRQKKEFEQKAASLRVEQIQEATIKTKEESKKGCRICIHADIALIDSELRKIEEEKGTSKPVREKYGFSAREIADHILHW